MVIFTNTQTLEASNGPFYARNDCGVLVDRDGAVIEEVDNEFFPDMMAMLQDLNGQTTVFQELV